MKMGERDGVWFFDNNTINSEYNVKKTYRNGVLNGPFENKNTREKGTYKNGRLDGEYEKGNDRLVYRNGNVVSFKLVRYDGNKTFISLYGGVSQQTIAGNGYSSFVGQCDEDGIASGKWVNDYYKKGIHFIKTMELESGILMSGTIFDESTGKTSDADDIGANGVHPVFEYGGIHYFGGKGNLDEGDLIEQALRLLNNKKYTKAISLANYETKYVRRGYGSYYEFYYDIIREGYFYTNRYEESIDAFKNAIRCHNSAPGYSPSLTIGAYNGRKFEPGEYNLWLGACYEALGKEEEAITYYKKSANSGSDAAKKRLEELEAKQAKKQEEERKRIETEKIEAAKNACHLSDFLLANPEQNNQTMLIPVSSGNKYGYINTKGEYIIAPQFDLAYMFSDGLALVRSDGKWGYISENGKYVIPAKFERATPFADGLAFAIVDDDDEDIICINKKGETQFKLQQEVYEVHGFSEGLAHFRTTDDKYGYIDKTGKVVIAPQYDAVRPFRNGLSAVSVMEKGTGFVNQTGEIVIKPQFAFACDFSENKAAASKEGDELIGFIDKNGKYIINPQFNFAGNFSEGMANVRIGEKWGYINENGEILIKPQFDDAQPFKNGLAKFSFGEKWGLIDKTGKVIVGAKWCCSDVISNLYGGIIFARDENSENKWRIIDGNCNFLDLKFGLIPEVLYEHWVETDMMNMPPEYYSPWVGKY